MTPKDSIVASLKTAHGELEKALTGLAELPSVDMNRIRFAAHTLNNYLTVTAGSIALIQVHLNANPDDEVATWLNNLKHATALMTHTVLELVNAAPGEGEEFVPEKLDLPTLARRVSDYYASVAEPKEITVDFEADVASPFVWADRIAVAAVLDNLLSNAVKFSPPRTRVWVRVTDEPGALICTVRDEGPGVKLEEQGRLFQRGARLSNVPTGGEPSTGYGLAVARELTEKLGGTIWCESQPGHGASFSVRLPAYSER